MLRRGPHDSEEEFAAALDSLSTAMAFFEDHSYLGSCQAELAVSRQMMTAAMIALKDEFRDCMARAR